MLVLELPALNLHLPTCEMGSNGIAPEITSTPAPPFLPWLGRSTCPAALMPLCREDPGEGKMSRPSGARVQVRELCMCGRVCGHLHVHACSRVHTYIRARTHAHVHVSTCVFIYTNTLWTCIWCRCACVCLPCLRLRACMCAHIACASLYVSAYARACVCVCANAPYARVCGGVHVCIRAYYIRVGVSGRVPVVCALCASLSGPRRTHPMCRNWSACQELGDHPSGAAAQPVPR